MNIATHRVKLSMHVYTMYVQCHDFISECKSADWLDLTTITNPLHSNCHFYKCIIDYRMPWLRYWLDMVTVLLLLYNCMKYETHTFEWFQTTNVAMETGMSFDNLKV